MGLQVWLPLNGDIKQQGISSITMTGSPNSWTSGKIGQCAHFTGNTANVIYNNTTDFNYTDNFSWAIWVKTNYTGTTAQYIFTNGRADTGGYGYGLQCVSTTNCRCRFGNSTYEITVNGGEWTHLAFTKKGNIVKTYKNGVLWSSYTFGGTLPTYSDGNGLGLGCFHYSGNIYPFYGDINDFRIYDHCLSPREVKEISKGLVLHYPLAMPGQENIIANTSHEIACTYPASGVKDYYSVRTKSVPNETQYTLSFEARSTVDGDHLRTHFYSPNTTTTCESSQGIIKTASDGNMDFTLTTEWRRYWVVYTQTETTAIKSVICPRLCSPASYPSSQSGTGTVYVRNQKLERGPHPTPWIPNPSDTEYSILGFNDGIEYDVSGYNHNGTKVGVVVASADTPRYSTSSLFDGSSYIINNTSTIHLSNEFTIAWWGKVNSWQKKWEGMFLLQNTQALQSGTEVVRILSCIHGSTQGVMDLAIGQAGGNADFDHYSWPYIIGEWAHYVCTYKAGVVRMYKDGSQTYTATIQDNSSNDYYFTIGRRNSNCNCQMSDFRIYNTALSAADILELYHTPISLSNNGTLLTQGEYVES